MSGSTETVASMARADGRPQLTDGIDLRQARVVIGISLRQALRPATTESGRGRRPLLTLAISMLMMGGFFSVSRRYAADAPTYFIGLFTAVLLVTITGVIPQSQAFRERDFDLLFSKPISQATHRAAWIFLRFFSAWLIASSFSFIPLVRAMFSFDAGVLLVAGTYLMMLLAGFSTVVLWTSVVGWLSRRVGIDGYRKAAQTLLLVCMLALLIPSFTVLATGGLARIEPVSLQSQPWVNYFPPAWFARFFLAGFDGPGIIQRIAALAVAGAAFGLALSPRASRRYLESMELAGAIAHNKPRTPLGLRIAGWISALPKAGKLLIPEQTLGVMSVVLPSIGREEYSRLRALSSRITLLAFSAWCFISPQPYILLVVAAFSYGTITDGTETMKRCSQPGGAWMFRSCPLAPRNLEQGIRYSVLLKYFMLPGLLTSIAFFRTQDDVLTAAALSLTYFVTAGLLCSLMMVIAPALPLTQEATKTPIFWTIIVAWMFNIPSVVLYFGIIFLLGLGRVGIAGFVTGLAILGAISHLAARLASKRLSEVESS